MDLDSQITGLASAICESPGSACERRAVAEYCGVISQDLTGRNCIVTGANAGIGEVTARELARAGARVFLACRSEDKARAVMERIQEATGNTNLEILLLDLNSLASTRTAAQAFLERDLPLHLLVNNAGLAGNRGLTSDGFEVQFGVNHLGPFLFTRLLLPALTRAAPSRIVNVASRAHIRVGGIDYDRVLEKTKSVTGFREYCVSKLANVLFNIELAERLEPGVSTYAVHPGVIKSEIWRRVPWPIRPLMSIGMLTVEEGAQTSLYCASAPELEGQSGNYYAKCKEVATSPNVTREAASELWRRSEEWCREYL